MVGWLVEGLFSSARFCSGSGPAHRVNISFRIMLLLIRQQFGPAPADRQCC